MSDPIEPNQTPGKVHRSDGLTPSERYLKRLCDKTFLSLWSYSGIYRDQFVGGGAAQGKEVCDLLVIFERHILIFSDKDCDFPDTGDLTLDWARWFRRAILKSASQIWGAERWISEFPQRLYLDPACQHPLPILLPNPKEATIHRVVVAHGVSARCQAELGGSGSLMIAPSLLGNEHTSLESVGMPFTVGHIDPSKGFIHILDDTSLDILLKTLDTVTDFIEYLVRKEDFIESGKLLFAAGEEELLGWYLGRVDSEGHHAFTLPSDTSGVFIDEGIWERFESSPERESQVEADEVSYAWDALIEQFAHHIIDDTQYYAYPRGIAHQEIILRFMAREPRTRRRMLANSILEIIRDTPKNLRRIRVAVASDPDDPYYVFLLLPWLSEIPEDEYREVRRKFLEACCMVVKLRFPYAKDIVGIATETGRDEFRSEDALYLDARKWTPEMTAEARSLQKDLQILEEVQPFFTSEKEYPADDSPLEVNPNFDKLVPRNAPCPCGSGAKYKFCHGAAQVGRSTRSRRRKRRRR